MCRTHQFGPIAILTLLIAGVCSLGAHAGPASKWYLVHETIVGVASEVGFPGEVLSYDPATGAVASEQSIVGNGAAVDGFTRIDDDRFAFSLNRHAALGGLVIAPNDVILSDGGGLSKAIDGSATGIPDGVKIDAVHRDATGQWVISLDVHAVIGGTTYGDGDLIGFDGSDFFRVASESSLGLTDAGDVVGIAQGTGGQWLLTMGTGGASTSGIGYHAGDVVSTASDGTVNAVVLSSRSALGIEAGVSALGAEPAPDGLFSDRFEAP